MSEEEKTAEVAAVEETEAAPAAKKARKKWPIVVSVSRSLRRQEK